MSPGPTSAPPPPPDDPVAVARGWLTLALEECPLRSDGALALCAAWDELDLTGSVGLVEPRHSARLDVVRLVDRARSTLRGSVTAIPSPALLPLARALDLLDDAARLLRLEASCEGEPWH